MTGLLLDTHVALWAAANPSNLAPQVARQLGESDCVLYFSLASAWELAIKSSRGKIRLPLDVHQFTQAVVEQLSAEWLPISLEHVARVEGLPFHHADSFDRLLVAQALCKDLTLVTADVALQAYGVKIMPARA